MKIKTSTRPAIPRLLKFTAQGIGKLPQHRRLQIEMRRYNILHSNVQKFPPLQEHRIHRSGAFLLFDFGVLKIWLQIPPVDKDNANYKEYSDCKIICYVLLLHLPSTQK